MPRRRYESTLQTVSDINITPLMDLTFLLLIVFMITAPMLEYEIDVSPPQMNAEELEEERSVMVNVTAAGDIMFHEETVTLLELTEKLSSMREFRPETVVLLRADEALQYKKVMEVMKAVRAANIVDVSLVTQAEEDA